MSHLFLYVSLAFAAVGLALHPLTGPSWGPLSRVASREDNAHTHMIVAGVLAAVAWWLGIAGTE